AAHRGSSSTSSGTRSGEDTIAEHSCKSRLNIQLKPQSQLIHLDLHHIGHKPYYDRSIPPIALEFIEARLDSTPGQIFQDMRSALPVETDKTTQKQVYYWWRQRSSAIWRPHDNAFLSAMASIQQDQTTAGSAPPSANVSARLIESHGQVRGMMLLAEGLIETLAASTIEISMDGTFGTNNAGHELLGVLAEMDGTGVPLAYCFLDTRDLPEDGCKINIIKEVLNALKDRGIDPQYSSAIGMFFARCGSGLPLL
ncbi:unnamed protein product, partial [Tilletia laevis]